MSYLFLDPVNKRLAFASGCHEPMILLRGEKTERISTKEGLALGMFESEYSEEKIGLSSGDLLALYTDGVTEAKNAKGEEFGAERLTDILTKHKLMNSKEILDELYRRIKGFAGRAPQHDDITVIIMKVL